MAKFIILWLVFAISMASAQETVPSLEEDFKPVLEKLELSPEAVRPGDTFGIIYYFKNLGTKTPKKEYNVFVHFEYPKKDCANILMQQDHPPMSSVIFWKPGKLIADGPYEVTVPEEAPEGKYWIHIGLCIQEPPWTRIYETYAGTINISREAKPEMPTMKKSLTELKERYSKLKDRIKNPTTLEGPYIRFVISKDNGVYYLVDKRTKELWFSNPFNEYLCRVWLKSPQRAQVIEVNQFDEIEESKEGLTLAYIPIIEDKKIPLKLKFNIKLLPDGQGVQIAYQPEKANNSEGWQVERINLLDEALWVCDTEKGYVIVPYRMGVMLKADSGQMFTQRYNTYAWGCHMKMLGMVKNGSAALVTWDDPYVAAEIKSLIIDSPTIPGRQVLLPSLNLSKNANSISIHLLGKGNYVDIAKYYRQIAKSKGLYKPFTEKIKQYPNLSKLFGAPIFKPFVLVRTLESSRFYPGPTGGKEQVSIGYTFDEVAQIAEHCKKDLGIDKALFVCAGWIHRGYDNQHPDILPACPECGGNEGLAEASKKIQDLGYLFGLHDNYQDIYKDSPSWDEQVIMKHKNGDLVLGGNWAGGQCWLLCSQATLKFAYRNMPEVKRLFSPSAYFTDTTLAASLFECFDPNHPLSFSDDMKYKTELIKYTKSLFDVYGSEEGVEWAVPYADYFEGLLSHYTETGRPKYELKIPLFELVYRDCVTIYTHQGDRATPNRPDYILRCISLGRMPLYHFGEHLYFKEKPEEGQIKVFPTVSELKPLEPRKFSITYRWEVEEDIKLDRRCFVHFTNGAGEIKFQNDHDLQPPLSQWKKGTAITDGPYIVEVPEGLSGSFDIRIGLYDLTTGRRYLIKGLEDGTQRYLIGKVVVDKQGNVKLIKSSQKEALAIDPLCFARADNGWAEHLNLTDRLIKNTYEILSPLNRLTATIPMTEHQFLTEDLKVELTNFGEDVQVIVNTRAENFNYKGIILPPYGFLIDSPTFKAFHALKYNNLKYSTPTLFTIRSLDGKPIENSQKIRIYHGFGDSQIILKSTRKFAITKEAKIAVKNGVLRCKVVKEEEIELE